MNLSKHKHKRVFTFLASGLLLFSVGMFIQAQRPNPYFELSKNLEIFTNIFKELNTYYVDPIEPGKLTKVGIDAMLSDLDPYTNYITESDIEDFEFMTTGKYGGIGAALKQTDKETYIGEIYEGSPAQKYGLKTGDQLISIDNKNVDSKSIDDISLLLKGSKGTKVLIKVKDALNGKEITKEVVRGEIEISNIPYAGLMGAQNDLAYARVSQFTQFSAKNLRKTLDSLKGINPKLKGVMLDLRGNPGGLLDEAVEMCNLFIDAGQLVVNTKGKDKEWDKSFATENPAWDTKIPVVVLINSSSASASEIVSGTLQDLDRAVVIGSKSFGKGLVQTTRPIGFNARLKLTTAKYYTPSGRCIQAIDYSHRNKEGVAEKYADSSIESFKTKNGRLVKSGGGVTPDIIVQEEKMSPIGIAIFNKNLFFNYATQYVKAHKSIGSPQSFSLSDNEFADFTTWLSNKDYAYKTKTEIFFDSLNNAAQEDKFYTAAKSELAALKTKLQHDKKQDLSKNKTEIKTILENEIVSRYYFQKGRILQSIKVDSTISKAIETLQSSNTVNSILKNKN